MNAIYVPSTLSVYSPFDHSVQDDEKKRIMERVYRSDVFKEFVQQWGKAMPAESK